MNPRIVIAATAAVLLAGVGVADAKHHKRHKAYRAPVAAYVPASPYAVYPNRPPWAAPWQCFTDEGYGRFLPCDMGGGRGR